MIFRTSRYFLSVICLSGCLGKNLVGEFSQTIVFERGVHQIHGNLRVERGQSLLIRPGAELLFDKDSQLIILGSAQIIGSKTESIVFRAKSEALGWGGISIESDLSLDDLPKMENSIDLLPGIEVVEKAYFLKKWLQNHSPSVRIQLVRVEGVKYLNELSDLTQSRAAIRIAKSFVEISKTQVPNVFGFSSLSVVDGVAELSQFQTTNCKSEAIVKSTRSFLYASLSTLVYSCEEDAKTLAGPISAEGLSAEKSNLILVKSEIFNSVDDAVDLANSRAIILDTDFKNSGDNGVELTNAVGILANNSFNNDRKSDVSLTDSNLIIVGNTFKDRKEHSCVLLRNNAKAVFSDNSCQVKPKLTFIFDLRKCLVSGPCATDQELGSAVLKYLHLFNPQWKKLKLAEMMDFGGPYKEALLKDSDSASTSNSKNKQRLRSLFLQAESKYWKSQVAYTDGVSAESPLSIDYTTNPQLVNSINDLKQRISALRDQL
jgi:hypothetical protein